MIRLVLPALIVAILASCGQKKEAPPAKAKLPDCCAETTKLLAQVQPCCQAELKGKDVPDCCKAEPQSECCAKSAPSVAKMAECCKKTIKGDKRECCAEMPLP